MLSSIQKHLLSILRYIFNGVLKSVCLYSKYSIKKKNSCAEFSFWPVKSAEVLLQTPMAILGL